MKVIYLLGVACFSAWALVGVAQAQDDWTATPESLICRSSTEVREVKTYVSGPAAGGVTEHRGCRVDYIKGGKTRTLWSSRTSSSYCHGKAATVAARLKATHFTCEPLHLQRSD
jgi:hypothetical protein